jgi:hypothetical protein
MLTAVDDTVDHLCPQVSGMFAQRRQDGLVRAIRGSRLRPDDE